MTKMSVIPNDSTLAQFIGSVNNVAGGGSLFGLKRTASVFERIVNSIASAWRRSLGPEYSRSVKVEKKTPFKYEIYSENKMVSWIENGLSPFDMKNTHTVGPKSRLIKPRIRRGKMLAEWTARRKDGTKYTVHAGDSYAIIPFRHGTSGGTRYSGGRKNVNGIVMNQLSNIIGDLGANRFKRSRVMMSPSESGKSEMNALGEMVARAEYSWGDRLELPENPADQDLQGMVAMAAGRGSVFMTFRVVSKNSQDGSWMHPGIKAQKNLSNIINAGQMPMEKAIQSAMMEDLGL